MFAQTSAASYLFTINQWWWAVSMLVFCIVWICLDESYVEDDLLCLLNTGEVCVFTVPSLRRQIVADVIARDNVVSVLLDVLLSYLRTTCTHTQTILMAVLQHTTVNSGVKSWKRRSSCRGMLHDYDDDTVQPGLASCPLSCHLR